MIGRCNVGGKKSGKYVWKKLTAQGGDFVDFVTADVETAYPDGGEQGGYWYEKVVEGVDLLAATGYTKIAVDEFVLSARTQIRRHTFSHSLGEKPKLAIVIRKEHNYQTSGDLETLIFVNRKNTLVDAEYMAAYEYDLGSSGETATKFEVIDRYCKRSATASTFYIEDLIGSVYVKAGSEYTVYTFA